MVLLLQDKAGIIPALQKLSFAGKNLDDAQRTLAQYGGLRKGGVIWHAQSALDPARACSHPLSACPTIHSNAAMEWHTGMTSFPSGH